MPLTRKILFTALPCALIAVLMLSTGATTADSAESKGSVKNVRSASVQQKGRSLVLVANTIRTVNLKSLDRFPARARNAARLCFRLVAVGGNRSARSICLGGATNRLKKVGLTVTNAAGKPTETRTLPARIKRPRPGRLVVTLPVGELGLLPAAYDWSLDVRWKGRLCPRGREDRGCPEAAPSAKRSKRLEIKRVVPVGCTTGAAGLVTHGPRRGKLVAFTLDDGPGPYTAAFLDVLKAKQVRASFFVLGQQVAAYPDLARRIVQEGHEIANHSWKHDLYPSAGDLSQTSATIRSVTGFKPCSFRPPGGAQNGRVIAGAGQAGMKTILWDVDPFDWRLPGTDRIRQIIVSNARAGSIVLSHDAGGNRSQTLAALPRIIDQLRAKGYAFTTVTELLGGKFKYRMS